MKNDINDLSNRLKTLENAVTSDKNILYINILNRQGKIAHKLYFKFTKPIKRYV